jgi:glutamyl-tRNA synthetase
MSYRGRIAPTPSWFLHLGHARTFLTAAQRAAEANGVLVLRMEDVDRMRCRNEYIQAAYEDMRWVGLEWQEGPDVGGPCAPYSQRDRMAIYLDIWQRLRDAGFIYPSRVSRRDLMDPNVDYDADDEPIFPVRLRPHPNIGRSFQSPGDWNWRFRVEPGRVVEFVDERCGRQIYEGGVHFGDFIVWRRDGIPSYELAAVVDDVLMGITEVVRGADLLKSTARQLLLYEALGAPAPTFYHSPLVLDSNGRRLAKRDQSLSLRELREIGETPEHIRLKFGLEVPAN